MLNPIASAAMQLTQAALPSSIATTTAAAVANSAQRDIVNLSNAGLQASATASPVSHDGDGDGH